MIVLDVMDGYEIYGNTVTFWEVASADMPKFRKNCKFGIITSPKPM